VSEFARIGVVALLAVLAQSPQGRQPSSPTQQPPRFRGGTNLVRVDAFATTNGVPVQDLKADDFEIFEDGAPQKIDTFEHIVIDGSRRAERVDPSSVSQANQMVVAAADPHRRVFVVYLDIENVEVAGSHNIKEPLIDFMNRVMGDDDLLALMTPEMSASQLTFGRKTDMIERGLREDWAWGRRGGIMADKREQLYERCFLPLPGEPAGPSALSRELIKRRRERMVLESLRDLVHHMEALRDARTAVIAVTDGWLLYRPDENLAKRRTDPINHTTDQDDPMPGSPPPVGVGRGGTLTKRPASDPDHSDRTECERDQMELSMMDDAEYFRDLFGEANRANVSFYPIDPRGLTAFDASVGENVRVVQDQQNLNARIESLQTLAVNTDGLAMVASSDLGKGLRTIADDLTSYYLIGYRSTNAKLDGRYRTINVRSKRAGVSIRARQGYRAASEKDVNAAKAAGDVAIPDAKAAVARAIGTIETDTRARGRTAARAAGDPLVFHRGPSTGNQMQPADARIFPRSDRLHLELEGQAGTPVWAGAVLDRAGTKTAVPVTVGERTDPTTGQRWLTADVTLAPLGVGDYVIELTSTLGTEQKRTFVPIRVTQ
jgi:VWFA-related protein